MIDATELVELQRTLARECRARQAAEARAKAAIQSAERAAEHFEELGRTRDFKVLSMKLNAARDEERAANMKRQDERDLRIAAEAERDRLKLRLNEVESRLRLAEGAADDGRKELDHFV